jgi:trans-2,3-dihydro-3-hydroxyanthranilate isomerase
LRGSSISRPGHTLPIEQGVEMGRASLIALTVNIVAGALTETRIGGAAVKVSEGVIAV